MTIACDIIILFALKKTWYDKLKEIKHFIGCFVCLLYYMVCFVSPASLHIAPIRAHMCLL